ncbi:hypothetical protein BCR44DRAFT_1385477 [Catenaria anguillulae PL171]|uniref:Uncharacterized protein n=1 Tax=Catenaria anguillulae PL171 TaxID=765915 RepID=A0A1Y2I6L1_9FUNG|nr:hypothetical protein BCR44DRAFT_1385477 [Catenaria anguillulae PL171]
MQPFYSESVTPSRVDLCFDGALGLTPMERVMLSSNGSLQRVLSGFYNAPIDIKMVKNVATPRLDRECVWTVDREIHLVCLGEVLCVATSSLEISDPAFYDLLITKSIGLGQFFRHIGVLPTFQLLRVTKLPAPDNLSREYTLSCPGVVCTIVETFPHWIGQVERPRHSSRPRQVVQRSHRWVLGAWSCQPLNDLILSIVSHALCFSSLTSQLLVLSCPVIDSREFVIVSCLNLLRYFFTPYFHPFCIRFPLSQLIR